MRASGKMTGIIMLLAGLISLGIAISEAQNGYPEPADLYINDYADVMSSSDITTIRALLGELKSEHGIEATVLTITSIHDYDTGDETIESFATNLFNTWGIGSADRNDGVLILVAVQDRQVRIEVGSGYGDSLNDQMDYVINEFMLSSFRREHYSQGILNGVRAVIESLTGVWPDDYAPSPTPASASTTASTGYTTSPGDDSSPNYLLLGGGGAGIAGAAGMGIQRFRRYRKRRCPHCGAWMDRLDEATDDMHLDSGKKLEEMLASVDYDVWKCPQCAYYTVYGYNRLFSGYQRCPRCSYRTVSVNHQVQVRPTYTSTGSKVVTEDCRNCDYHQSHTVVLPRLQHTSSGSSSSSGGHSSGGGSFGGGHSSGGGASGRW